MISELVPKGHVLITGGAKRIGRELALEAARRGWDVTLHYHKSESEAHALAQEIEALGRSCRLVQADFEEGEKATALLLPEDPANPVTALINNASLFEHDEADPDGSRHLRVNNVVPRLLAQRLMRQLPKGGVGRVVHLLDATPLPGFLSAYAASRAALCHDLDAQAAALAPRVLLTTLALGPTLRHPRQSEAHFKRMQQDVHENGEDLTPEQAAHAVMTLSESPPPLALRHGADHRKPHFFRVVTDFEGLPNKKW